MPGHGTYSPASRKELDDLIAAYNRSCPEDSLTLKQTENGELCVEGYARIHWGVTVPIQFRKDDGASPVGSRVLRLPRTARLSYAVAMQNSMIGEPDGDVDGDGSSNSVGGGSGRLTLDAIDESSDSTRQFGHSQLNRAWTLNGRVELPQGPGDATGPASVTVTMRRPARHGAVSSVKQQRLNRRCSINGHFYRPETAIDFTPSFGMLTRVRVSSRSTSADVVAMLLAKFKIENPPADFGLYVVKENGDMLALQSDEPPLLLGTMLRESPDVRIFLMDARTVVESGSGLPRDISPDDVQAVAAACTHTASAVAATPLVAPGAPKPEPTASDVAGTSDGADAAKEGTNGHHQHWRATSDFESLPEPMLHAFLAKFLKDESDDIQRIQQRYWYHRKQLEVLLREAATRSDSGLVETYL